MTNQIEWNDFAHQIAEYAELERDDIQPELTIYGDLGMDSLGLFSLGMHLQKIYPTEVPFSTVATIKTLKDIFVLVNQHIKSDE